jgi:hypothetical protein
MEDKDLVQCTLFNSKQFAEKFKESQKGRGTYVDALSLPTPYVFQPPGKMDYLLSEFNPRDTSDPLFDPDDVQIEKVYSFVVPDYPSNAKAGAPPSSFKWTDTGQRDLVRAREKALDHDKSDRKLRDETLSRFLRLLSPQSRTLLNNTKGFADAVKDNDLWEIVNRLLPSSHNQVSTSAVQRRTREFLSSVQDSSLPAFTDTFVKASEQFIGDWDDAAHPGYIKIDALLSHTFIEAVRMGTEGDLLKPALEALSLNAGPHRSAVLQTAIDSLSGYYMRNKPTESIEQSVAFKASSGVSHCACCQTQPALGDLHAVSALLTPRLLSLLKKYCTDTGQPLYCAQCITHPPKCACGRAKLAPFHAKCSNCFRKTRGKKGTDSSSDVKANVAQVEPTLPPVPPSPSMAQSYPSAPPVPMPQHLAPYGMMAHYGYPPQHHPYGYVPPPLPPPREDDAINDYSATSGHSSPFFGVAALPMSLFDLLSESPSPMGLRAFQGAHDHERRHYYVDSCASLNCTDVLAHLTNARPLPRPIAITGIGDKPCSLTHVGDLVISRGCLAVCANVSMVLSLVLS